MKPSDNIVMRKAHASDAKSIASISRLHIEHGLRWRWTPAKVRRSIKDRETMVLVASQKGEIAGFAIMKFGEQQAHLHLMAVQPLCRRRKIATGMLKWLEESCVTAGITQIRLEVRAANRAAREFYSAQGYRRLAQVNAYYDQREPAIVMGKSFHDE